MATVIERAEPRNTISAWLALQEVLATDPEATGVFVATAHPSKFREVVEPAIGRDVPLPPMLAEALQRPRHAVSMEIDYAALARFIRAGT